MFRFFMLLVLTGAVSAGALAQTREAEIMAERLRKSEALRPETVSRTEAFLRQVKDQKWPEKLTAGYQGLRASFGNMVTGSGFAAGPEFFRDDLAGGRLLARVSTQFSTNRYQKYGAELAAPKLWGERLTLGVQTGYRNYAGMEYYGPGPDSARTGRTNFRLEDVVLQGGAGLHWGPLKAGGSFGGLWINTGPGANTRLASTEKVYGAALAPGIDRQTRYTRPGVFFQLDYRDNPNGPKTGGNYVFQYTWYQDRGLHQYSFRRMDIDLQQYLAAFNKTRRLALRAKATLTETDQGNLVPFYLQPQVGGSDDLRGFRPFRFTDRNAMVLNAEYRWEVFSGLDGALFADAGKVFPRRGLLNFGNLESSVGFGLRANVRNATFLRLDVGFSHEGFAVWLKFNDVFLPRMFGTGVEQPVY